MGRAHDATHLASESVGRCGIPLFLSSWRTCVHTAAVVELDLLQGCGVASVVAPPRSGKAQSAELRPLTVERIRLIMNSNTKNKAFGIQCTDHIPARAMRRCHLLLSVGRQRRSPRSVQKLINRTHQENLTTEEERIHPNEAPPVSFTFRKRTAEAYRVMEAKH